MIVLENWQNKKGLRGNDKVPDEAVIQEAVLKYDTVSCYFMSRLDQATMQAFMKIYRSQTYTHT
jgi:hypothetical protein